MKNGEITNYGEINDASNAPEQISSIIEATKSNESPHSQESTLENNLETNETEKTYPNIDYIPAYHINTVEETAEFHRKWEENWESVSIWNDQVDDKIAKTGINFITVDSVLPGMLIENVLQHTPRGVTNMNLRKTAYVIGADFAPNTHMEGLSGDEAKSLQLTFDNNRDEMHPISINEPQIGYGEMGLRMGISTVAAAIAMEQGHKSVTEPISRRTFLRGVLSTAGAATTISTMWRGGTNFFAEDPYDTKVNETVRDLRDIATNTESPTIENIAEKIGDILVRDGRLDDINNGRTALLDVKTRETLTLYDRPNNEKVAIVMGKDHLYGKAEATKDKDSKEEAIRKMIQALGEICTRTQENFPTVSEFKLMSKIFGQLGDIEIYEVTEPNRALQTPQEQMSSAVKSIHKFKSPTVTRLLNEYLDERFGPELER